jgi:hypothetical protein
MTRQEVMTGMEKHIEEAEQEGTDLLIINTVLQNALWDLRMHTQKMQKLGIRVYK